MYFISYILVESMCLCFCEASIHCKNEKSRCSIASKSRQHPCQHPAGRFNYSCCCLTVGAKKQFIITMPPRCSVALWLSFGGAGCFSRLWQDSSFLCTCTTPILELDTSETSPERHENSQQLKHDNPLSWYCANYENKVVTDLSGVVL